MATRSPMLDLYETHGVPLQAWGAPERGLLVPLAFEAVELEYAAIRKGAALMDLPNSGTIVATGADRIAFLNNLITQELKGLEPMRCVRGFWLNRKGRIEADLRLCETGEKTMIATDALVAGPTAEALSKFVFSEDVTLEDASERLHRLALHGPLAARSLMAIADTDEHINPEPNTAMTVMVRGVQVHVEREDSTGEVGLLLTMPADRARAIYEALAATQGVRACGWMACNIARIENGWPLFQIDFTSENLPAETGVLHDRVSFTKGCYLGQEVVARMHSLGQPKQKTVALRLASGQEPNLPSERANIYAEPASDKPIGTITSSTLAPMLGATPIALARVRTAHCEPGTVLHVEAEGRRTAFEVMPQLAFWTPESAATGGRQ